LSAGSPSVLLGILNAVEYISFIPLMNLTIEPRLRGILRVQPARVYPQHLPSVDRP
jgi:hypothetical protein